MTFLAPIGALFGLSTVAIVALYFLRVRRPEVVLSSTLLWGRAVRDRQASVPWQRLRKSWLLVLQLLAAALLALALMRPAHPVRADVTGHTIVALQAGSSMQATDVAPSRFDAARAAVSGMVDRLGPTSRMTIIWMGPRPAVLADSTGDRGPLRRALDAARPGDGAADLGGAIALAAAAGTGSLDARLVVVGDGVTTALRAPTVLPFPVEYRRVGASGENLAVAALTLTAPPERRTAVVRVENLGRQHQRTSVELRVDDRLVDARPLELEAGSGRDVVFPLPAGADHVSAALTPRDLLTADDTAVAVARPPRPYDVVLVTDGDPFMERALGLRADVAVRKVGAKDYQPGGGADMYVFDGYLPAVLPDRPYWVVAPPENARLGTGAAVDPGRLRAASAGDPLVADADLQPVHVARGRDLRRSQFGRVLIAGDAGPVVMVRDEAPRAVLFGFDVHESDLPLRPAFPLLVDRLSAFLLPPAVPARPYQPGDPVTLPTAAGVTSAVVRGPDGRSHGVRPTGGSVTVTDTNRPGLYTVEQQTPRPTPHSHFVVAGYAPDRSAIAPRARLPLSGSAPSPVRRAARNHAELWWWLAAAFLAVLTAEWVVFHRGI